MIKILAIGNSFSQDATALLYDISISADQELKVVNLYIGGCSLDTHWNNIMEDSPLYEYELNGQATNRMVSIKEMLLEDNWNYITLQQVSGNSGIPESYHPYLTKVSDYIKQLAPQAEQLLHQTWAYETDSSHPDFAKYGSEQRTMYQAIEETYQRLSEKFSLKVIPCGRVIQALRSYPAFDYTSGGISLCRDGFHMNLLYGRYALAATWYEFILKESMTDNTYVPISTVGSDVDMELIRLIRKTVHHILKRP